MCGEQSGGFVHKCESGGSPPRVRGTAMFFFGADRHEGITPACAGNSLPPPDTGGSTRDHPRVCGEQMET